MAENTTVITPLIQEYVLDFASNNNFFFINGVQGDGHSVRYAKISLTNNGQPYYIDVNGVSIAIRGTTSNGEQYLDIETPTIIDSSTVQFEITQKMLLGSGKGMYEMCIMSRSSNQLLTSFPFYVVVSKSGFNTQGITETQEFINLAATLSEVAGALDACAKATSNANSAATKANDSADKADNNANYATEKGNYADMYGAKAEQATNAANEAAENANTATAEAYKAIEALADGVGIKDKDSNGMDFISQGTTWSSSHINEKLNTIKDRFNKINEKLRIYTTFYIDGSVEVNNIDDVLVMNDEGNVYMASSTVDSNNDNGDVSMNSNDLNIEDDGNGNVSITED